MQVSGRAAASCRASGSSAVRGEPNSSTRAGSQASSPRASVAAPCGSAASTLSVTGESPAASMAQPGSNSRALLASSTAWVRRRALILDMIAVICVLTVASAIDSS